MTKTAMTEAFKEAGVVSAGERLSEAVAFAFESGGRSSLRAYEILCNAIRGDAALCWEAFKEDRRHTLMNHIHLEAVRRAGPKSNRSGAGHATVVPQHKDARVAAAGGDGQMIVETQNVRATPLASIAARAAALNAVAARSVFDTLIIDGRPIGDITKFGFADIARRHAASAWFADAVCRLMSPDKTLRDSGIPEEDITLLWNRARQLNGVEIRP